MGHARGCYAVRHGGRWAPTAASLYRSRAETRGGDRHVQPLGSVRLPLPSTRRGDRPRRRDRLAHARFPGIERAQLGWMARQPFRIGDRCRPPRSGVRCRSVLGHRPLPLGIGRRRCGLRRVPGRRCDRAPARRGRSSGARDRRLCRDRRPPVHQHVRRRRLCRGRARHDRRAVGRDRRGPASRYRPAERLLVPAHGVWADHPRFGRAVREGPAARGDSVATDRGADPCARLRLRHRRRHAAARGGPRHPLEPRAHLSRRPAGRDEHLRAQHRDDARPGARDRLLAVHREPVPGGTAARADGR
jgi:hypothetical protein